MTVRLPLPDGCILVIPGEVAEEVLVSLRELVSEKTKRDLPTEIATVLTANGQATVPEIARAIRARDERVRHVLNSDKRFSRAQNKSGRSGRAKLWMLAPNTSEPVPQRGTSISDGVPI